MKMSDVTFNTRMTDGGPSIDETLTFIGTESVNAAKHAVYRFDTLTQLNKELVELIAEMNVGYSADIRADELIKRAKELAE